MPSFLSPPASTNNKSNAGVILWQATSLSYYEYLPLLSMAGWNERARQLRASRRRRIPGLGSGGDQDLDIECLPLLVIILILLAIGAGIATTIITNRNPNCVASAGSEGLAVAGSEGLLRTNDAAIQAVPKPDPPVQSAKVEVQQPKVEVQQQPKVEEKPKQVSIAAERVKNLGNLLGPVCSEDQLKHIATQLTPEGCFKDAFHQECSFTKATTRVCRDSSVYMRNPFGVASIQKSLPQVYTSVTVGFPDEETSPQDMLYVFSHGAFSRMDKGSCLPDVRFVNNPGRKVASSEVYLLDYENKAGSYVKQLQDHLVGVQDNKLIHDTTQLNKDMTIAKWVDTKLTQEKNPIIHFFRLHQPRPDLIMDAKSIWHRILYMEFQYDSKGTWDQHKLKDVVQELRDEAGFACYWQGEGHLWKITDCWQPYYEQRHWSFVVCLNTKHPESTVMRHQMEQVFQETLNKKDLKY
eukprot:Nitzschia sp. Nitz4//scaffold177_size45885//39659//41056//NITZ4_007213-RA/size45885-processed-gene-0.43-mRNA-1//1//CDS//3329539079//4335//frame0